MSGREEFLKIAHFELANTLFLPHTYQWFWTTTLSNWTKKGLPDDIYICLAERTKLLKSNLWTKKGLPDDVCICQHFGFDRVEPVPLNLRITQPLVPCFEKKVMEKGQDWRIVIDESGVKAKEFIPRDEAEEVTPRSMSQWLEFPVKDRKSWKEFKKRLNPHSPGRYPDNWDELKKIWQKRDYPLGINVGSFYGWIRDWIGVENLSYMFYDEPNLIHQIMEYLEYFMLEVVRKAVEEVGLDYAHFWEDMAYKNGSIISPKMFKEFMSPHYKKITDYLRGHGIDIITVDSDGNINELIPLWLEVGVNGFLPLEVAAGMDAVFLRKEYGKECILFGNIDKRALAKGKREIETEVKTKIPFLLSQGGYFPGVDHAVPPDVSYKNFLYYLDLLRRVMS